MDADSNSVRRYFKYRIDPTEHVIKFNYSVGSGEIICWNMKVHRRYGRRSDVMKVCTEATERSPMDILIHFPLCAYAVCPVVCTNQPKTFVGRQSFDYRCLCEDNSETTWWEYKEVHGEGGGGVDPRDFCAWFLCRRWEKKKQEHVRETCELGGQDQVEKIRSYLKRYTRM
jgi:hypothetical protein